MSLSRDKEILLNELRESYILFKDHLIDRVLYEDWLKTIYERGLKLYPDPLWLKLEKFGKEIRKCQSTLT